MALVPGTPTTYNSGPAALTQTVAFTVPAGSERLLVVTVGTRNGPVMDVTFGGVSMAVGVQVATGANVASGIWYLIAPNVGTANIVVYLPTSGVAKISALVYTGAAQASPISAIASAAALTSTPSVTIASATGEIVQDAATAPDAGGALTPTVGAGQTTIINSSVSPGDTRHVSSREAGAASVTMSWTGNNDTWPICAVSIRPPATPLVFTGTETGKLAADVFTAAGTYIGPLPTILQASVQHSVDEIGQFQLVIPSIDQHAIDRARQGREVRIVREGEPDPIFYGVITERDFNVNVDGDFVCTISGVSMAAQLLWDYTYFGYLFDAASVATAVTTLLAATGWSNLTTGSAFANISERYENMTLWAALRRIAETQGGYLRETNVRKEIEVKQGFTASGIRLIAPEHITPEIEENPLVGLVKSIKVKEFGANIANRLVPLGVNDGNIIFDLRWSNRITPYEIFDFYQISPSVTDVLSSTINVSTTDETRVGVINFTGSNRVCVAFIASVTSVVVASAQYPISVGGRRMELSGEWVNPSGERVNGYTLSNMQAGELEVVIPRVHPDTVGEQVRVIVVALQDGIMVGGISMQASTGTGTTASNNEALNNEAEGGVVVSVAHTVNNRTFTSAGGQTRLVTLADTVVDIQPVTGPSTSSWALSASDGWGVVRRVILGIRHYYIQDDASVAAYGRRVAPMIENASKLVGAAQTQIQAAANTLYDIAAARLLRMKDPVTFYEVEVAALSSTTWLVGDTMRLDYQGFAETEEEWVVWVDVNADLIVLDRRETFDVDGVRAWELTLASGYAHPLDDSEMFAQVVQRLVAQEGVRR